MVMANCHVCNAELNPELDWCGQCLTPIDKGQHEPVERPLPDPDVRPPDEYSAWRAGPYSFGPVGRIVWTAVVIALGGVLTWLAARIGSFYGTMGLALVLVFIAVYVVFAVLGLWGIWRPTRVK